MIGRLKEMINRGGEKINPSEVDAVMASHPAVLEAASFGLPHRTLGEDLACAVILRPERTTPVTGIELRAYAAERLARFKVPRRIYFVDTIPRGELGKIQRWALAEQFAKHSQEPTSYDDVEKHSQEEGWIYLSLHEIWARILDFDSLGADEDFFEAGGDSLAAMNMLAEVDERFGANTSAHAADFLDEPTLGNLAQLIGKPTPSRPSQDAPSDMRVFPVRETGASRVLYCIPTDAQEGLYFRRLAKHLHGKMDVQIVRPFNTFHSKALFALEKEGKEAASVIQRAQPQGPYFVSGYCYGGVVAVEAARQLVLDGQDVRVILVRSSNTWQPRNLSDWKFWFRGACRQWHALWTSEHPGLTRNSRRFARHVIWSLMSRFRRILAPLENRPSIQKMIKWIEDDHFPLYVARPVDAPFLHFLCADEPRTHRISRSFRLAQNRKARY